MNRAQTDSARTAEALTMSEPTTSNPLDICGVVVLTCIENAMKRQLGICPELLSAGLKRTGLEVDYSPSTEVKKMWIYTSNSPYTLMVYCLIS
jgi:hypothetical protein